MPASSSALKHRWVRGNTNQTANNHNNNNNNNNNNRKKQKEKRRRRGEDNKENQLVRALRSNALKPRSRKQTAFYQAEITTATSSLTSSTATSSSTSSSAATSSSRIERSTVKTVEIQNAARTSSSPTPPPPKKRVATSSAAPTPPTTANFRKMFGTVDVYKKASLLEMTDLLKQLHEEACRKYKGDVIAATGAYVEIERNTPGLRNRQDGETDVQGVGELKFNNFILHHMIINAMRKSGTRNADLVYYAVSLLFPARLTQSSAALLFPRLCDQFTYRAKHGAKMFDLAEHDGWKFKPVLPTRSYEARKTSFASYRRSLVRSGHIDEIDIKLHVPLSPCQHDGPCTEASPSVCPCRVNGICHHLCQCSDECVMRFPGCDCRDGACSSKRCQCFLAGWECHPTTCEHANCAPGGKCRNVGLQRGWCKSVDVRPSRIPNAGLGLFVLEPVKKGELIMEYVGAVLAEDQVEERSEWTWAKKCSYFFDISGGGVIDGEHVGSKSRFANHSSKKANVNTANRVVDGESRVGFYAKRDLSADEEVLFDYAWPMEAQQHYFGKK